CEDCGIRWEAVCLNISVNLIVEDTKGYCEELSKEEGSTWPQNQLCLSVFRPSLSVGESTFTLSCVTPKKDLGYTWRINHSALGHRADSGCQIIPVPETPPHVPILKKILSEPCPTKAADQDKNEAASIKESIIERALTAKNSITKENDLTNFTSEGNNSTNDANVKEISSENNNDSWSENNMAIANEEEFGEIVVKEEIIEEDEVAEKLGEELEWQMNEDINEDSSHLVVPTQEKIINNNTLERIDWANILGSSTAVSSGYTTLHQDVTSLQESTTSLPSSIKAAIDFIALSQQLQMTISPKRRPGRPLNNHRNSSIHHQIERGIECGICKKKYESRYKLKLHMNSHTGERPFICDVCGVGFSRGPNLNAHRRVHSNYKPFKCSRCGTGFRHPSDRMVHMVTEVCTKWAKHIKKTENGGWLCVTCGESFADRKVSQHHSRQHETGRALCCPVCKENFRGQKAHVLIKHLKFSHPEYIKSLGL
ncbi:unnamed protein product, partial [Meganyctiphanes norvegica]